MWSCRAWKWSVLLVLLTAVWTGCARRPVSSSAALPAPSFVSRDGSLRYRIPSGWFDATADSQVAGSVVWIMRNDYAATIAVQEIHLDDRAREELNRGGLLPIARLTMALTAGNKPSVVRQPPALFAINGRTFCGYDLIASMSQEARRVVLFTTGRAVYSVTALVSGDRAEGNAQDVFNVQQDFLGGLRW